MWPDRKQIGEEWLSLMLPTTGDGGLDDLNHQGGIPIRIVGIAYFIVVMIVSLMLGGAAFSRVLGQTAVNAIGDRDGSELLLLLIGLCATWVVFFLLLAAAVRYLAVRRYGVQASHP